MINKLDMLIKTVITLIHIYNFNFIILYDNYIILYNHKIVYYSTIILLKYVYREIFLYYVTVAWRNLNTIEAKYIFE